MSDEPKGPTADMWKWVTKFKEETDTPQVNNPAATSEAINGLRAQIPTGRWAPTLTVRQQWISDLLDYAEELASAVWNGGDPARTSDQNLCAYCGKNVGVTNQTNPNDHDVWCVWLAEYRRRERP